MPSRPITSTRRPSSFERQLQQVELDATRARHRPQRKSAPGAPANDENAVSSRISLIGEIGTQIRTSVPLRTLPKYVPQAFVAVEDQRFYQHDGVDMVGIAGAIKDNILGDRRGASTITQQLVGNMHPDIIDRRDKTLGRKLREQQAAREMEKHYTKEQILEAYLNQIGFGHGWYGIESAARTTSEKMRRS